MSMTFTLRGSAASRRPAIAWSSVSAIILLATLTLMAVQIARLAQADGHRRVGAVIDELNTLECKFVGVLFLYFQ